jgi:hypothetical protein
LMSWVRMSIRARCNIVEIRIPKKFSAIRRKLQSEVNSTVPAVLKNVILNGSKRINWQPRKLLSVQFSTSHIGHMRRGWIYNYLCNQCLSPLMSWVRMSIRARCNIVEIRIPKKFSVCIYILISSQALLKVFWKIKIC